MFDHDEMKAGHLQDLIEKLMEMKSSDDSKPEMGAMPSVDGKDKMAMLAIANPADDEGDDKPDLSALVGDKGDESEPDEDDMSKPLCDSDFMAMKRKHLGL